MLSSCQRLRNFLGASGGSFTALLVGSLCRYLSHRTRRALFLAYAAGIGYVIVARGAGELRAVLAASRIYFGVVAFTTRVLSLRS